MIFKSFSHPPDSGAYFGRVQRLLSAARAAGRDFSGCGRSSRNTLLESDMRSILLWLIGVPIPVIILLAILL